MATASVLMADAFEIQPCTPHRRVIRDEGAHAVIGVSVGNGCFSAGRLHDLARWGLEHFGRVDLVCADLYVAEMYEAFGYPPGEARRKAAKSLRGVRAKVRNAVTAAEPDGARLRRQPMSRFRADAAYQEIHRRLWRQLDEDDDFRALCDDLVGRFLSARGEAAEARQRAVCLEYVCAELPLFLDAPAILRLPSSLVCYHQRLPMAELPYGRGAGLRASRNQGRAIVTPAAPSHTANSK
ncbi:tRNA-dependent cyclodipeptide synthase [Streptomyces sp. NPDC048291]|uniref:tRNA-dependent cyclodipeptide synthase n=1 Tax=Streptomyces sp. NPDC048291 TaxID=3365530 RepID=UPI0037228632